MEVKEFAKSAEKVKAQLYKTAFLYMGNEADAIEMVDESIYRGFCASKKLREQQFFKTWLTRILINTCNSELKRKKREIVLEELPENGYEEFDNLPLQEAIAKLPKKLKEIIILRFFMGFTLEETAETLKLPRGTVTSRQKKALEVLKLDFLKGEKE